MLYWLMTRTILPFTVGRKIKTVEGLEHLPVTGPYIIASNHIHWIDPILLMCALHRRIKQQIHFISVMKKWNWMGTIPIDKNDKEQCLKIATSYLKQEKIIGIFPEGKRMNGNGLSEGRTGVARLALWSQTPVIPIGIIGPAATRQAEVVKSICKPKKEFTINIGEPLTFKQYTGHVADERLLHLITDQIMGEIARLALKTYLTH